MITPFEINNFLTKLVKEHSLSKGGATWLEKGGLFSVSLSEMPKREVQGPLGSICRKVEHRNHEWIKKYMRAILKSVYMPSESKLICFSFCTKTPKSQEVMQCKIFWNRYFRLNISLEWFWIDFEKVFLLFGQKNCFWLFWAKIVFCYKNLQCIYVSILLHLW